MNTLSKSVGRSPQLPAQRGGWLCLLAVLLTQARAADISLAHDPSVRHVGTAPRLDPAGSYPALAQAVQAARYAVEPVEATGQGGGCYAANPAHALRCWFRADGLELQAAGAKQSSWKLSLRLCGYGREAVLPASVGGVSARQNRVELARANGALVEWYENKQAGLEQGFTVMRPPEAGAGPLRLILEAAGDLLPELELEGGITAAKFVAAGGQAALRYSGLKAWDASERELPAHLEVQGRRLALVVNDQGAQYPVTIDPLITRQEAKLTAADGAAADNLGGAVSMSGDGRTALVGAYTDDTPRGANAGSAYVFVRSGSGWIQQVKLTAADGAANDWFGSWVALSDDGSTALVGAFWDDTPRGANAGSAYVFVRNGASWTQLAKLMAADGTTDDEFGGSVALSGDGRTALVAAMWRTTTAAADAGCAYVFVRTGNTWSQQAVLTAADAAASDHLGSAVSLSGDGHTALVGAAGDDTTAGAQAGSAYVFSRNGTNWSQQVKLTAADGAASAYFGTRVALNGDGHTALVGTVGTPMAHPESAYVFVQDGSSWSQQAKLTANDRTSGASFGSAIALSNDGRTALVGASTDDTPAGADAGSAYVFRWDEESWTQAVKFTAADGAAGDCFGVAVSLNDAGDTVLVGAPSDDTPKGANAGSAYVFRLPELAPGYNRLTAEHLGGGAVRLAFLGLAGTNYALDRTFDLTSTAVWEPQVTNPAATDGYLIVTNTPDSATNAFWRMRLVP